MANTSCNKKILLCKMHLVYVNTFKFIIGTYIYIFPIHGDVII